MNESQVQKILHKPLNSTAMNTKKGAMICYRFPGSHEKGYHEYLSVVFIDNSLVAWGLKPCEDFGF